MFVHPDPHPLPTPGFAAESCSACTLLHPHLPSLPSLTTLRLPPCPRSLLLQTAPHPARPCIFGWPSFTTLRLLPTPDFGAESSSACTLMQPGDPLAGHVGPPTLSCEIKLDDIPEMGYTNADKPYPRGEVRWAACCAVLC